MTEAMTSLQDISNDKEEDEKIRWTANESIALIGFGQKAEDFEGLKSSHGCFGKTFLTQ